MKRNLLRLGLALYVLFAVFTVILPPARASAAGLTGDDIVNSTAFNWINRFQIKGSIGGQDYIFKYDYTASFDNPEATYKIQNYNCSGAINVALPDSGIDPLSTAPTKIKLTMQFMDPKAVGAVPCQSVPGTPLAKTISNSDGAFGYFFGISADGSRVQNLEGDDKWSFTQSTTDAKLFTRDAENGKTCQDILQIDEAKGRYRIFELTASKNNSPAIQEIHAGGCYNVKTADSSVPVKFAGKYYPLDSRSLSSSNPLGTLSPNAGSASTDATPTLQCNAGYNPLNWLLCGAVKGMVNIVGTLDRLINSELSIGSDKNSDDPSQIFGSSNGDSYNITAATDAKGKTPNAFYDAWSSVRNLALGLMVIAGLVVIVSQAFGAEIVDAYTFRKILPRLLIAAFAITLSWQLLQFFVKLTNDLGYGVRFLIYGPFSHLNNTITGGTGGNFAVDLLGIGAVAALGIFGLLSFAATAALAVFLAFILLVLRQIVVIVLIILAPIAIVAYILPNTQNIYKLWWESLSKALLVFPIIAAFIAAGRVFALVAIQPVDGSPPNALSQFIGFAAYFAPYFLLPLAFKLAGGTLGRLAGAVNDRGRGGFDRLKNFRQNTQKRRMTNAAERVKTGNTFKRAPVGSVRERLNRGVQGTAMLGQAGLNPRNMRTNLRTALNDDSEARVDKFRKENAGFNSWGNDDAKLSAAQYASHDGIGAELAKFDKDRFAGPDNAARREEAISQIMRTQKQVDMPTFQKARIRNQATTGTGYQYTDEKGMQQFDASRMLDDINKVYGNDRNGAGHALAEMRSSLSQSGQVAGVAGYGVWASQLEGRNNGTISSEAAHNTIMDNAIDSAGPGQAIYGKPASAAAMGAAHARKIVALSDKRALRNDEMNVVKDGVKAGTHSQEQLSEAQDALKTADGALSVGVAGAAGIYDAMSQASPANASAMANELMGVKLPNAPEFNVERQREQVNAKTGTPILGPDGRPLLETVVTQHKPETVREYITSQMNGNVEFANRRRDLGQATLAEARQAQQQRTQTPGIGGMPGGMPPSPMG